jgi:hypothetical protein
LPHPSLKERIEYLELAKKMLETQNGEAEVRE